MYIMPLTLPLTHSDLYLLFRHFCTCIIMKQASTKMIYYTLKHHYEKKNEKKCDTASHKESWCALILRLYDNSQHSSKVYPSVNTVFPGKPKSKETQSKPKDLISCIPDTKAGRNEHPRLCSCFHQELLLPGNGDAGLGRSGWKPAF